MRENIYELQRVCKELKIGCKILGERESIKLIQQVLHKYKVQKPSGQLAIYKDTMSIPIELYEHTYSKYLNEESVLVFFDQETNKNKVIEIFSGKRLGEIMENAFGMNYFVTNKYYSYLLAVNWYVIEGAGNAKNWMRKL